MSIPAYCPDCLSFNETCYPPSEDYSELCKDFKPSSHCSECSNYVVLNPHHIVKGKPVKSCSLRTSPSLCKH